MRTEWYGASMCNHCQLREGKHVQVLPELGLGADSKM